MDWYGFFDFAFTYRRSIFLLTAIQCLIFAFVILIPNYNKHFSGVRRWANFFALTFLVLGLMNLVRYLNLVTDYIYPNDSSTEIIRFILSGLANLFLFITTIFIRKDFFNINLFSKRLVEEILKGWQGTILIIILLCSTLAALSKLSENKLITTILEIPDHLASTFVLVWFGYIIFRELAFRRSPVFASIALLSLLIYAGAFIFQVFHLIDLNTYNLLNLTAKRVSNAITFISFFLKVGIFFPTFFLITSNSNEFRRIEELLEEVTINRVEFLESEGILRKIIEILKADKIILTILLPGKTRNLVTVYEYPTTAEYNADLQKKPQITLKSKTQRGFEKEIYEQVFNENRILTQRVVNYPDNLNSILQSKVNKVKTNENVSLIATPIRHHGAIIASLEIYLDESPLKFSFSRTDVLQIQRIAVFLSRIIQANRELSGIDQLITRLGSLRTDLPELDPDKALTMILEIIDDLFSPLAMGIYTNIGFDTHLHSYPQESSYNDVIQNNLNIPTTERLRDSNILSINADLVIPSFEYFNFFKEESQIISNVSQRSFGQFVAVIPKYNDRYDSPTLINYLLSRVMTNIIADMILDFARDYFSYHLKELSVSLNNLNNLNISNWFNVVENTLQRVNLLWAVVTEDETFNEGIGENRDFICELQKNNKPAYQSEIIALYHLERTEKNGANHVIKLNLKASNMALWLGVRRKGFGSEITNYRISPWKMFLERLVEIADAALYRILIKEFKEENAKEAAEFHGLATTAITTGTLLHQIGNQVKEITFPIGKLKDNLYLGKMRGTKDSWQTLLNLEISATQLKEITQLLSGIVKTNTHRPCQIGEILAESQKLFEGQIEQYGIKFINTISPKILSEAIDIPYYVGSFTITNLVINAKDALKSGKTTNGFIKVEAQQNDDFILLHVIDNGPGIPEQFQRKIFEKGFTTKSDGTGLGLYFTERSLKENGADIKLTSPEPFSLTRFTIRLPKPRAK